MKILPEQLYKIVETDDYLCIVQVQDNVAGEDVKPLVIADKEKLCDYLMAYLSNRELVGKSMKDAHEAALTFIGARRAS